MAKYGLVKNAILAVLDEYVIRLTVRQVFYRLVSPPYQLIPNTKSAYKYFDNQLVRARERDEVPWDFPD